MVLKERKKYHIGIRNELQRQKAGLSVKKNMFTDYSDLGGSFQ